jgi:2-isopropylmalate synthase
MTDNTSVFPRFKNFRVKHLVDESLREGLERCMFPVPIDDLYRLFEAQTEAGIRETIIGSGPEEPDLFRRVCQNQDKGKLPADIRPVFLVLLNCWDATYENFKKLPREWVERAVFSFGMVPHKKEEKLFDKVFDKFAQLGGRHFKSSILNNFVQGINEDKYADMKWQIDWVYSKGIRTVRINDSVGKLFPEDTAELCTRLVHDYPDVTFCLHCHNDRDLALANQLTSVYYGFEMIEGSLCGYGNRSGITPLEILASVCQTKGIELGEVPIDVKKLCQNAQLAEEIFLAVPNTYRPISGRFVTKANYGVLNIPDFLGAEMERDYFLNIVNIHPNTIIKALKANGFSSEEIDDGLIARLMDSLRELIEKRHAGAKVRYSGLLQEILTFYDASQLTYGEIAKLARGIQQAPVA